MITLIVVICIAMAIIETIIEPAYFVKSVLKIVFFLFSPLVFMKLQKQRVFADTFSLNKKRILKLLGLGLIIYVIIMAAFFITKRIFNYSSLVNSLSADQKVSQNSFILIALYISFCNSLLEEFLFRFVAFIKLSEYTTKNIAYIFSSCMFALYHIAMIGSSFPVPLLLFLPVSLHEGMLQSSDCKSLCPHRSSFRSTDTSSRYSPPIHLINKIITDMNRLTHNDFPSTILPKQRPVEVQWFVFVDSAELQSLQSVINDL